MFVNKGWCSLILFNESWLFYSSSNSDTKYLIIKSDFKFGFSSAEIGISGRGETLFLMLLIGD